MTVLQGLRVIDFTEYIAGPFGTMLLGDMGADVIKVEPPGGDRWRQGQFYAPNEARANLSMNRSKRSIALDLATPDGKRIVHKLVRGADVVAQNFRHGVAERLGIDYETLSEINPSIIYCHNTAYGVRGPEAQKGGYDILSMAATGFLTGAAGRIDDGRLVAPLGFPAADISSSMFQALAICAALWHRERTGKGQRIDTSLLGAGVAIQASRLLSAERFDGEQRESFLEELQSSDGPISFEDVLAFRPDTSQSQALSLYFRAYETRDRPIAVACLNDRLRQRCAEIIGIEDPRFDDPNFDPLNQDYLEKVRRLVSEAESTMRTRSSQEWMELFDARDVPCGLVKFAEELYDDPQVAANGLLVDVEHPTVGKLKMAGAPFEFRGTPLEIHRGPPSLSQHADEILSELGYTTIEAQEFRDRGIVT
jgi:formyl-CoA transferase